MFSWYLHPFDIEDKHGAPDGQVSPGRTVQPKKKKNWVTGPYFANSWDGPIGDSGNGLGWERDDFFSV